MQCEAAPRLRLHAQRPAAIQSRSQRGGGRADELQLRLLTSDVAPGARLGLLLLLAQLPSGGRGEGDGPRAPPGAPAGAPARDAPSAPARHGGLGLGSFLSSMTGARSQAGQAAPAAAPPPAGPAAAAPAANGRARSRLADAGPRTDCEARDASPSPGSIWASVWARKPLVGKRCRVANRWSPITERRQRAWRGQSAQHQRCPAPSPQRRGVVSHEACRHMVPGTQAQPQQAAQPGREGPPCALTLLMPGARPPWRRAQVSEAELVREVLCACQAVDGRIIRFSGAAAGGRGGAEIAPEAGVSAVHRQLVLRLCELGWLFRCARGCAALARSAHDARPHAGRPGGPLGSRALQNLATMPLTLLSSWRRA